MSPILIQQLEKKLQHSEKKPAVHLTEPKTGGGLENSQFSQFSSYQLDLCTK